MPIEKRWVVKPQGDPATVAMLAAALRISPVLANLLVQRGIDNVEKAEKFFKPSLADLHDPFLMKDMDRAVERVERAVANNEKIMVYGDYDVDGCTAVALVYKFLRQIGHKNLMFYIPDRYTEGYGISIKGIDLAARKGVGLIIALDCGIKATEKIVYAKTKGVDFIICDHHLPAEEIPKAVAVLDPKRVDCSYPFDELSGCGVGFKLVQAYAQKNAIPFEQIVPLLDLLVVSIASDIVPLVGENRILAYFGLKIPQPRAVERAAVDHQDLRTGQAQHHHRRHRLQDRAAHQRRRPDADGRERRERLALGRTRRRGAVDRGQRVDRRGVRQRDRRLQPGPQVDRPLRHAGGARFHRAQPRHEGSEKHGDLQPALDEGHRGDRGVAPDRDLLPPDGGADDEQRLS